MIEGVLGVVTRLPLAGVEVTISDLAVEFDVLRNAEGEKPSCW